jgi:hypothetical protein
MDNISKQSKPGASDDSKKKAHSGPANGVAFCDDGLHLVTFGLQVSNLTNIRRWSVAKILSLVSILSLVYYFQS